MKVSHSDLATPVVPIPKKDGSVCICEDFKVTVIPQLKVNQYPLPRIDDIFASLGGSKHFLKIDLRSAYLHMEMDDESKTLLTLNTHKGLYQLNRLAFGIASTPAMWQRVMDQLLSGIPKTQRIIVTGETDDEHLRNLEMVLQRLLDAGLRAHPAKTRFFKTKYCGHAVSADGLYKLPVKVDAIRDSPQPTNISQFRSFLGLVNYYARFLPNLSTTLQPLNRLLQHNTPWHWTDACTAAFDEVKRQIGSDLVLTHFHPDLPLRVASDLAKQYIPCKYVARRTAPKLWITQDIKSAIKLKHQLFRSYHREKSVENWSLFKTQRNMVCTLLMSRVYQSLRALSLAKQLPTHATQTQTAACTFGVVLGAGVTHASSSAMVMCLPSSGLRSHEQSSMASPSRVRTAPSIAPNLPGATGRIKRGRIPYAPYRIMALQSRHSAVAARWITDNSSWSPHCKPIVSAIYSALSAMRQRGSGQSRAHTTETTIA